MRISKPIKGSGFFFFQEDPSLKIFGKLKISKSGEILLRLRGNEAVPESHPLFDFVKFSADPNNPPFKRPPIRSEAIVGEIKSKRGHKTGIRLESDKFFDPQSFQFPLLFLRFPLLNPDDEEWSITLKAETAFLSEYLIERLTENPSFTMIRLGFNNLNEWSTITGLSFKDSTSETGEKSVSIHANLPRDLSFSIPEGLDFKMEFSPHWELDYKYGHIKQQVHITLSSASPEPIEAFQRITDSINRFFCFATNGSTHLDLVEGFRQESKSHEGVRIFYQSFPPMGKDHTVTSVQEMLFLYKDCRDKKGISDKLEEAIVQWIECSQKYKQVFDLYFDSEFSFGQDMPERFLKLYRGLEHFHGLAIEDYEAKRPDPDKRLREIMSNVPHYGSLLGKIEDFSAICTHVRNYYTHLDRKSLDKSLKKRNDVVKNCVIGCIENDIDLEILHLKLKFLFQVLFLVMMNLKDKIEGIMGLNTLLLTLEWLDHRKKLYDDDSSRA